MNRRLIILLIFLLSVLLRLWSLNEMGRTWDEEEYIEQGYKMIELIKAKDFNNSYFYTTYDHPPLVKYLYGITAHLDLEKVVDAQPIFNYDLTYSRLFSALIFSFGVVIVVLTGWKLFSFNIGVISGLILSLLPFSLGLSQLVTTESFKIFIYSLTVYSYILLVEKFSWKKVLIAGVVTGIALQVKQSNFLLIPLLSIMFFLQRKELKTKIKAIILVFIISVFIFIIIWPQAIFHFKDVYAINEKLWGIRFSANIWQITLSPPEIFFGRLMLTPVFYYIVYFFISIPVFILFLFFTGIKEMLFKKNIYLTSVLVWFLLPLTLSIYSWRQHGLRYIIEIYPPLCIVAAIGFNAIANKFNIKDKLKLFYFLPMAMYLFVLLLQIKPYYLDYFNELVGGVNSVYKYRLFQIGWWGQGIREAGLYVVNNAPYGSTVGLAVSPIHSSVPMPHLKAEQYNGVKEYDYVIVNYYNILREGFEDSQIRKNYFPVYSVRADKAILATVYKHK